ncbi:hypothetical protein GGR57DRAFT_281736 [Xylariaceae sp. FL1272]|nr:hypothetical protein GGR57DRAFT_281736 [Xylariaceae sp. FL1272]
MPNMAELPVREPDTGNHEAKRRRVRKGTRSCWECRRRKIRCQYASEEAKICIGCESRGTNCVSQEFADQQTATPERRITQRLGRVEEMLEKLVEKIMPDSYPTARRDQHAETPSASADDDDDPSDPTHGSCTLSSPKPAIFELLSPLREDAPISCNRPPSDVPTPASSTAECPALSLKNAQISRTLHALFPPQQDMDALTSASQGSHFVVMFFHRYRDIIDGKTEPLSSVKEIPPVTAHPAVLARRLMQLANCIQQLHPKEIPKLKSRDSAMTMMAKIMSVMADTVVYNDQLVGNVEGVETLALVSLYHANVGNLRKSWLILRRAISVGQMMGLDRLCGARQVKSVESTSCPIKMTRTKTLWFRLNFTDRYLSLLLGLPAGTDDNSFLIHEDDDEMIDKLEKQHTIVAGAIIKRNSCKGDSAFSATQAIDFDLEQMARAAGASFWQPPVYDPYLDPKERMHVLTQLMLHMNHYNLLILLHLPYVLRDAKERRWDYSKETCVSSSRQLLRTFLLFRKYNDTSFACRHTDYAALTAAMTLLLGHLDPKLRGRDQASTSRREGDRTLVEEVRDKLKSLSTEHNDKLSREAASIITRLLPLLSPEQMMDNGEHGAGVDCDVASESAPVRLDIPFLGTININAFLAPTTSTQANPVPPPISGQTPVATTINQDYENLASDTGYFHDPLQPTPSQCPGPGQCVDGNFQTFGSCLTFPLGYDSNNYITDFNTVAPAMQFEWSQSQLARPELAADLDQWTFQGFDTAYFESLFSSGVHSL